MTRSTGCSHPLLRSANDFELVPKHICLECGRVLICECERNLSARLLPHQTRFAKGTAQDRIPVDGYAEALCPFCRELPLVPTPKAPLRGHKSKVERYYWREIKRSYFQRVVTWMERTGSDLTLIEFERQYPFEAKSLREEALTQWKVVHQKTPLYDTREEDQTSFLARVPVPIEEVLAEYRIVEATNGHRLGRWISKDGRILSPEDYATEHYKREVWTSYSCERHLISALYGVLMNPVIQDPTDPKVRLTGRRSTREWSRTNPNTPVISYLSPEDFGTAEHFRRREALYRAAISEVVSASDLEAVFESRVGPSSGIRDYLGVHEPEVEVARQAIRVLPRSLLAAIIEWTISAFWQRFHGWPDLFLVRGDEYRWVEVKSPGDRLSQAQMRWFEWAMREELPASILFLKKRWREDPSAEPVRSSGGG